MKPKLPSRQLGRIQVYMSPNRRFLIFYVSTLTPMRGKEGTYNLVGASVSTEEPPIISRLQTSLKNQPTCPTAHPMRSPTAARHVPLRSHEKATRATGRYGAEMVTRPKSEIGVEGCRRDQR